jgi:hypothetical protein
MATLHVQKRIFRYEFVIRTTSTVSENEAVLERYLADQSRPRGFLFADTRFAGAVAGSTFELRPWDSMLWGTVVPRIEGYFVPTDDGSDVVVAVGYEMPGWTGWMLASIFLTLILWNVGIGPDAVAVIGFAFAVGLILLVVPPMFHGSHTAGIFARIYGAA